jgi:hypothetical protein
MVKNKFSVTNIEETMSDLLGSLSQAQHVADDWVDSDDTPPESRDVSPAVSPKNTTVDSTVTTDVSQNIINNIEIIISETGDNDDDDDDADNEENED